MLTLRRRTLLALLCLLTLVALSNCSGCEQKDDVVVIHYYVTRNFAEYDPDVVGAGQPPVKPPKGYWAEVEIWLVENTGKDAADFTFRVQNVRKDPEAPFYDYSPIFGKLVKLYLAPTDGTVVVKPKQKLGIGARLILLHDEDFAAGEEQLPDDIFYVNDAPSQNKIILVQDKKIVYGKPTFAFIPTLTPDIALAPWGGYDQAVAAISGAGSGGGNPGGSNPGGGNPGGGGGNSGGGNSGGGNSGGGQLPPQVFQFCVTPPGSGGSPQTIDVIATSPAEALNKLKTENLPDGGIGWKIVPGECPKIPSP